MHEVTGSSPVVPTTKKGRLLPSFFCAEAQTNLAPAGKERRNCGAGRRVARNAPPRGPPRGCRRSPVVPTTKKGRLLPSFFCAEAQANLAPAGKERRNRGARAQGRRVARNAPPRGPPSGGVGGALLSPPEKTIRIAPFCGKACRSFFPQSPFPFSDDQPPLTSSKGAALFCINTQSFGMLANPFARSSSVGI